MNIITTDYGGGAISFDDNGWFNATVAAAKFGKRVDHWLKTQETEDYITALCEDSNTPKKGYLKTRRGNNGGTWLHPDLAVAFARWLDVRFAIFCDREIKKIISGTHPHYDWKKMRSEAASSFKVMNEAVRLVREGQNKKSCPHHYSNEALLINFALVGIRAGIDRNTLSQDDLNLLAKIEVRNAVLIGQGFDYQTRKASLRVFASDQRSIRPLNHQPQILLTEAVA